MDEQGGKEMFRTNLLGIQITMLTYIMSSSLY